VGVKCYDFEMVGLVVQEKIPEKAHKMELAGNIDDLLI
jgi:hypothetical protein